MTTTAIICGAILILIGLAGYINGYTTGHASVTALIPAFIGIVLAALGLAGGMNEGMRKHLMHVAVIVALIGFIAPIAQMIARGVPLSTSPAVLSSLATSLVSLVFVVLAIKSFRDARRNA